MPRTGRPPSNFEDRFWMKVDKQFLGCWLWAGAIHKKTGYGGIGRGKRSNWKSLLAHRVSYELLRGPIPAGLQIDHLCRIRHCVNPDHLEAVTAKTNTLRGESVSALNAAKTHCKYGHPLTADNLTNNLKWRECKACVRNNWTKQNKKRSYINWTAG
jgi:hypothetical protein